MGSSLVVVCMHAYCITRYCKPLCQYYQENISKEEQLLVKRISGFPDCKYTFKTYFRITHMQPQGHGMLSWVRLRGIVFQFNDPSTISYPIYRATLNNTLIWQHWVTYNRNASTYLNLTSFCIPISQSLELLDVGSSGTEMVSMVVQSL